MRPLGPDHREAGWRYLLAGALMVGGPVWQYLYTNHYPFARLEAFLLPGAAALIGVAVGAAAFRAGGAVGTVLFGGLLFAFADLQFDLERRVYTAAILVLCIGLSALLRRHRAALACLTLGAFYAVGVMRPPLVPSAPTHGGEATARNGEPILVHIILDEQWGIGGLRAAGDTATATFLTAFYLERGFEVYDAAYSRFVLTSESVPATLSLGQPADYKAHKGASPYVGSLRTNPYFKGLAGLGYQIEVFQTTYLDFCSAVDAPVAGCHTVSGNSIANIGYLGGSWTTRAMLAGRYFLNLNSHIYTKLHPESRAFRRSITGGGLASAKLLEVAIQEHPDEKTAYFAHLLLPHRPIDVDAECRPLVDPRDRMHYDYAEARGRSWPRALALEAGQIRCTHHVLSDIIDAIDRSVGRDGAIVIVHGDHGARLHDTQPVSGGLSQLNARQLNASFSTILAVRRPGIPAAEHLEPIPVQDFVWELFHTDFTGTVEGPWAHYLRQATATEPGDTLRRLGAEDMLWVSNHE